jgi:hypothetical protein
MAQCDLCYKDDDNITEEMLKNERYRGYRRLFFYHGEK